MIRSKSNILDFTKLERYDSRLLDNIAEKIRKRYVDYLVKIGRSNEKNIDWWVLNFVSRNTYLSPFFRNICCLVMLKKRLKEGHVYNEIIVDSLALKKVIERSFQKYHFKVNYKGKSELLIYLWKIYSYFKIIIHYFLRWISGWSTCIQRKKLPLNKSIILIDTFIFKNSFDSGFYNNFYYPKLSEYINSNEKELIFYIPNYYGIKNYRRIFMDMRKSEEKFLLKEDYLKIKDYIFSLLYPFRIKRMKIEFEEFMGFDFSILIKEEILNSSFSSSSMSGLLNYVFAQRLKERDIKVKKVINWFENQAIDHGFNIGFRKFFPEVDLIGYQGFTLDNNYLSLYPTEQERICAVIPKEIHVIGKGYIDIVRKFCPGLRVKVAPAFRFAGLWNRRTHYPDKNNFTILIALPILISMSDEIISIVLEAFRSVEIGKYFFQIKPHPTQNVEVLKEKWKGKLISKFDFVTGDINSCVEKANVLISCASSVCLETLAKGIPVIIVANRTGLTQLSIPDIIKQDLWKLCYTPKEIRNAVLFYLNRDNEAIKRDKEIGDKIKKEFFEPVTKENVREFLSLK